MKKTSLLKISFALAIISLYTYIFAIMDNVQLTADVGRLPISEPSSTVDESAAGENKPSELNVANGEMPGFENYDAPVVLPADLSQLPETTAVVTQTDAAVTEYSGNAIAAPTTAFAATSPTATVPSENALVTGENDLETLLDNDPLTTGTFKISSGGSTVEGDAFDIVTRVIQAEIGSAFHKEAIKAQAVAIYTYIKRQNNAGNAPVLPIAANASERVKECTKDVWEKSVYYNNELIQAVYCASSAGWSASSQTVWGSSMPYLKAGRRDFDEKHDPNWGQTVTFTSNEIMTNVLRQTGIQLSGDPSSWLKIINHADTVYVDDMSIGGKTTFMNNGNETKITGRVFRERIMGFGLRSASFTFEYDKNKDSFTFKTNGYGHGAGLSQNGANILATHEGYDYIDILKYYYVGVEVR
ncbi:MAG: SpoIID/LytB domain-containing protein [Oscillospiraceae bacterium]|nr:SpoIID/LytB domain-containing protein [Oscillospiraceae bacterium]